MGLSAFMVVNAATAQAAVARVLAQAAATQLDRLYLLVGTPEHVNMSDPTVTIIRLPHPPTYRDWLACSSMLCPDGMSILIDPDVALADLEEGCDGALAIRLPLPSPPTAQTSPDALDTPVATPLSQAQAAEAFAQTSYALWDRAKDAPFDRTFARPGLLAWDGDWQHPAITERQAFIQMRQLLPPQRADTGMVYLGFPWATLIDLKMFATHRADRVAALEARLADLARQVRPGDRVVTVCQHIHMRDFAHLFRATGVTEIYWSHAIQGQTELPGVPGITLHPFPLFPVQQVPCDPQTAPGERPLLYSFVGAKGHKAYLTQVRRWIIDQLGQDARGRVVERDIWHYAKTVYQNQIMNRTAMGETLVDDAAANSFRDIMAESVFTLCPSGTGPNSIRLWEAALAGSIPVVLAESYRHPGPDWLWRAATVSCPETPQAVAALPDRLAALAADPDTLAFKRLALSLLAQRYGPDNFVPDILTGFGVAQPDDALLHMLQRLRDQRDRIAVLTAAQAAALAQIVALHGSTSWRVTRPLRWLRRKLVSG